MFLVGLGSGMLYLSNGDVGGAVSVLGPCAVIGLVPGVIFLFFAAKLSKERGDLERLGLFLARKGRATVAEVSAEFKWAEPDAEDRIVLALAENKVAGNFDRGTRQFYTEASVQNMEFVAKCGACGAGIGAWVSKTEPAKCSYCNSEPRPGFVLPPPLPAPVPMLYGPQPGVPLQYAAAPPGGAPAYGMPAYGAPAYGMPVYGAPGYGMPAYGAQAVPPGQVPFQPGQTMAAPFQQTLAPPVAPRVLAATPPGQMPFPSGQSPTVPPVGASYHSPYPEGAPPPPPPAPRRKRTVKFLFFSMKSGALKAVGFPLFIFGFMVLVASIYVSREPQFVGLGPLTVICSALFYLPPLLIGAALIIRAYREEKYKEQLLDIVDYIETYRRITLNLLAQKMQAPEEKVRKIISDILEFQLVEGYLTPDGSEFIISLRKEDVKSLRACPYCRNPNLNLQVIRGGSEKCPYCSGVIYFQEGS